MPRRDLLGSGGWLIAATAAVLAVGAVGGAVLSVGGAVAAVLAVVGPGDVALRPLHDGPVVQDDRAARHAVLVDLAVAPADDRGPAADRPGDEGNGQDGKQRGDDRGERASHDETSAGTQEHSPGQPVT